MTGNDQRPIGIKMGVQEYPPGISQARLGMSRHGNGCPGMPRHGNGCPGMPGMEMGVHKMPGMEMGVHKMGPQNGCPGKPGMRQEGPVTAIRAGYRVWGIKETCNS